MSSLMTVTHYVLYWRTSMYRWPSKITTIVLAMLQLQWKWTIRQYLYTIYTLHFSSHCLTLQVKHRVVTMVITPHRKATGTIDNGMVWGGARQLKDGSQHYVNVALHVGTQCSIIILFYSKGNMYQRLEKLSEHHVCTIFWTSLNDIPHTHCWQRWLNPAIIRWRKKIICIHTIH